MTKEIAIKKVSSRLYFIMMPRISCYGDAKKIGEKIYVFHQENKSVDSLSNFLFKELGQKIKSIENATKLSNLLIQDYLQYS